MTIEQICAILLALRLPLFFLVTTYHDFNGKKASPPEGFSGFIATCIATILLGLVLYGAGIFHIILGKSFT